MMQRHEGFTIIEILVAIFLLGIMMTALLLTLTGSLNLNSQANNQVNNFSKAQQVVEYIRNSWNNRTNYDNACVSGLTLPNGISSNQVNFINLSTRAQPITATNTVSTTPIINNIKLQTVACSSSTAATNAFVTPAGSSSMPPAMRSIVVSTGNTNIDTSLTINVLRP